MKVYMICALLLIFTSILHGQTPIDASGNSDNLPDTVVDPQAAEPDTQNPNNEFNISIGARFSFFEVENPTDLYYDLVGFVPSIRESRFGFYASLNQSRIESGFVSETDLLVNQEYLIGVESSETMSIVKNSFYRTKKPVRTESISLSFLPTIRIWDWLFPFIHAEVNYGSNTFNYNDNLIGSDTIKIPIEDYEETSLGPVYPYNEIQESTEKIFNGFIGIGLFFNYDTKNVSLQLFPSFGRNYNQNYGNYYSGEFRTEVTNPWYYNLRFILIEKNTQIKLGGELRQIDPFNERHPPSSYSIFISKQFSIEKIAEFLKAQ